MPSELREREFRAFLTRLAGEMPTPVEVPPAAVRRARTRLARTAIAGALAVILVAVGSVAGVRSVLRADPSRPADETSFPPIVAIPVEIGAARDLAVGSGSVWVSGRGVFRIDPATSEIVAAFPSEGPPERFGSSIVATTEDVWVSGGAFDGEVLRIDPETNDIVATIHTGGYNDAYALAVGAGAVWATTHTDATLLRIDLETDRVETIRTPGLVRSAQAISPATHGVAVLNGVVWVTASTYDDGNGELYGIDAESRTLVSKFGNRWIYDGVWAGFGSLWAFSSRDGQALRIDPATGSVLARFDVGFAKDADGASLTVGEGAVWVSDGCCTIYRIDPTTNRLAATLKFGERVTGLAVGEGAVWVVDGIETLYRIDVSAFHPVAGGGS